MAPSIDLFASSSLLCAEDDISSIFDDDNDVDCADAGELNVWNDRRNQDRRFNGGAGSPSALPVQGEDCVAEMIKREVEHLPAGYYVQRLRNGELDLAARKEAVDWIEKVHSHYNFGPLCFYLSVNYLDRFFSAHELPKGKAWTMQLLAVACLSLAAKVEETEVPLALDLQVGVSGFVFEPKSIQRMELLVMNALKWRMQSVTPFSFLDYFLCRIYSDVDQQPPRFLFSQAIDLIQTTIKGIDLLGFRPSEVSAAVAITVAAGEAPAADEFTDKAISLLSDHFEKERLVKCVDMLSDVLLSPTTCGASGWGFSAKVINGGSIGASVPQSPIGVLDASTCLSFSSTISNDSTPVGSCDISTQNSPPPKRRKL